jgi:hypothetical protein
MIRSTHRFAALLPASAAALAVAVGVSACGDSTDSSDQGNAAAARGQGGGGGSAADRKEAAAVMPYLRNRFNAGDGKSFCTRVTAAGKREIREYGLTLQGYNVHTCEAIVSKYGHQYVIRGVTQKPVRVRNLKLDNDKAVVTITGGLAGIRSIAKYKLAKDAGKWKLVDPISGARTRVLPKKYQ